MELHSNSCVIVSLVWRLPVNENGKCDRADITHTRIPSYSSIRVAIFITLKSLPVLVGATSQCMGLQGRIGIDNE